MPANLSKYFPRPTGPTLVRHYLPWSGAICFTAFSAHLLNPDQLVRLFPNYWHPMATVVWCNAHLGIGLYYYNRPHLNKVKDGARMIYTVWTTVLYNFGSVLFWSAVGNVLPESKLIRSAFGLLTSICFLSVGYEYLNYIDGLAKQMDRS